MNRLRPVIEKRLKEKKELGDNYKPYVRKLLFEIFIILLIGFCNLSTLRCIDPLIFSQHYGIKKLTHVTNNVTNKILNTEKILSTEYLVIF
jgi:hypothetical protein